MVQQLEMPEPLAGIGIHCHQRIAEQVGALAVAAPAIRGRAGEGQKTMPRLSSTVIMFQIFTPERFSVLPGAQVS